MPFTPFHMGPGLLMKGLFQGSFSLIIFGWTQIVMDIQPLIAMVTGHGHIHGFTHTFIGSTLIALISIITGKYLAEILLNVFINYKTKISWTVTIVSSLLGSYSHVLLDAIMHSDVEMFYPFSKINPLLEYMDVMQLHKFCFYTGLIGSALYFIILAINKHFKKNHN